MEQKSSKQRTNPSKNRLAEFFSPLLARESRYLDLKRAYKSILAVREKCKYDGSMRGKSLSIEIGKDELVSLDHRYKDILMNTRNEEVFFF